MTNKIKIKMSYTNGQKNWYIGTKSDLNKELRYLGSIYSKIIIEKVEK